MTAADIEDYVRWHTVEKEWQNWDAPWEKEDADEAIQRREWTAYYEKGKHRSDDAFRWRMEIEWNGRHIGWVSAYCIDENYEWIGAIRDGQRSYYAVGIDICEPNAQGKGVGTNVLRAFMNYCLGSGVDELYTQTWSGNLRMIRCAEKQGFALCRRNIGIREVDGQKYDGLTFGWVKASPEGRQAG